jgi:hypothetical protein
MQNEVAAATKLQIGEDIVPAFFILQFAISGSVVAAVTKDR